MKGRWFSDNDIPINVLSRLSARALHRLKYVSKEWYDLISDRSFIRLQLKKTESVSGLFFQEVYRWSDKDIESISYIPIELESVKVWNNILSFLPENVVILSSNNGLICCRSCFPTPTPIIYVCNPLIKQWTPVKWPNLPRSSSISLAFDPFLNPIDASTDFTLVSVCATETEANKEEEKEEEESCFVLDIYSSKTGLWRRSQECCKCNYNLAKNKGILVAGILHWLTDGDQILMFDPNNEISWLITVPVPASQLSSIPEMCIGESQDKLYYVIISEDGLQLWVLEDHFTSQWNLKCFTSLEELEKKNSKVLYDIPKKVGSRLCKDMLSWIDPLAFKDGIVFLKVSANIYSYQFETGKLKILYDAKTLGPKSMHSPIIATYTMSLVPLDE
ncbi:F-box protein At5g49610-like [Primulina eburnea]|uniref:F-box protein At5g49610-like n=1 Tax=Primulina eburnea TaxID=1245227 RepID=UPI003C6C8687